MSHNLPDSWKHITNIDDTKFFEVQGTEKLVSVTPGANGDRSVQVYKYSNDVHDYAQEYNVQEDELHFTLQHYTPHEQYISIECSITPGEPGVDYLFLQVDALLV